MIQKFRLIIKQAIVSAILFHAISPDSVVQVFASDGDPVRIPSPPGGGQLLTSVAIDGDHLAVGAPAVNQQIGVVHIFKRTGSDWEYITTVAPSDGQLDDHFGFSVALEGDVLVVGAPYLSTFYGGSSRGSVYIYRRSEIAGEEQWGEEIKLPAPSDPLSHRFGYDVAISNGVIVIGQPGEVEHGATHIYRQDGNAWISDAVLPGLTNSFGAAVDIHHDTVVVGVPGGGLSGYARVFRREVTGWVFEKSLLGSGLGNWDSFGDAVSVYENHIVIGAPYADGAGPSTGRAFVFERQGDQWIEEISLFNPEGQAQDQFGSAVQITESIIVISADLEERADANEGAVYVFERMCDQWKLARRIVSKDAPIALGNNLSLNHSTLAMSGVGAAYTSSLASLSALAQFAGFQNCFGKGAAKSAECIRYDLVADGSVDLSDFACIEFADSIP